MNHNDDPFETPVCDCGWHCGDVCEVRDTIPDDLAAAIVEALDSIVSAPRGE